MPDPGRRTRFRRESGVGGCPPAASATGAATQRGTTRGCETPRCSRHPGPERDAHPVDEVARPDPDEAPFADRDLPDPLRPGTDARRAVFELRFRPEEVAALLRGR